MTFKKTVDETPDVAGAWRPGLQALLEADRNRIQVDRPRSLKGSINVEEFLTKRYPGQRQWDYAVGYRPNNLDEEVVYWIEVHPANEGEVSVVLEKLQALKGWLMSNGHALNTMRRTFI